MKIELREITIRELAEGYQDKGEEGVIGYGGRLDIRPPYQREFIYNEKERNAVIDTASRGFPLNVMYWAVRAQGGYEVIDGQQRTISLCQFVEGDFSVEYGTTSSKRAFHNLQEDEQERFLNYKLMVYLCTGSDSEKLDWFKTINISGKKLTDQELRNAVYHGSWVSDAKRYFSKAGCPAHAIGSKYLDGTSIRQDYLETAIKWIANRDNVNPIEIYMSQHQHDADATPLWDYFQRVIDWGKQLFPNYRKEMRGVEWGILYNQYKDNTYNPAALESEVATLMEGEDVSNKKGIYGYIFTRDERHLNIRAFTDKQKREAYERQGGICPICGQKFDISDMEADHITPWSKGGKTNAENCQMISRKCNRRKSGK